MTDSDHFQQSSVNHEQAAKDLHAACVANDLRRVRELLNTKFLGADDATHELKGTRRDTSLMRCLLEHGADPNSLHIRSNCSPDVLRLLAKFGYDIQAQGHLILQDVVDSRETLDWLLDQGVDINRTDCTRLDGGFRLAGGQYDNSLKVLNRVAAKGDIRLFDHLVSRGADPSQSLALHRASRCQDPEKTTAMISHLINKHRMDVNGDSGAFRHWSHYSPDCGVPLLCAVYNRNLPAVQELLKKGAHPENAEHNPVYHAIGHILFKDGYLPALRPLLNAGADSTDALDHSVYVGNVKAARICLECGADPVPALEQEQARVDKAATEQDVESAEDEETSDDDEGTSEDDGGMSDEMKGLLEDWKHSGEIALSRLDVGEHETTEES